MGVKIPSPLSLVSVLGPRPGREESLSMIALCYHLDMRIKTKTVKKAVLIIGLGALLLSGLVPALSLLLK